MLVKSRSSTNRGATTGVCTIGTLEDFEVCVCADAEQKTVERNKASTKAQMAKLLCGRIKVSPF